ncbi:hypothetical protein LTR62_000570 [Meristemomyces frigidus]|uniref:Nucleoporin n=1 Tax=Meristemomyces frigidus TaxID=1508187 RepID=A0AAN7TKD4_9PEZI|nr:hypothetical protein LTR62_000570 [Meristemomyces frigidus]
MSVSETPEPGTERASRNPRRRQRQHDTDNSLRTAPRRKRSKLSEDLYVPRPSIEIPEANLDGGSTTRANGHPRGTMTTRRAGREDSTPARSLDIAVRGGKPTGILRHRALRGDGATVLTQNKIYSVKLLPSTPKELLAPGVEYRGSILDAGHSAHQHLALAVTRQKAYVWDYNAHTQIHSPKILDVPFPAGDSDALPYGALVPGSSGTDMGLVLVSATSGRVAYFESIERAAALSMFQERKAGVDGTISRFSLTEQVVGMTPADHAGFILTLSSGRILQLTLRDAQGKARIFTQALRPGRPDFGLFGSIKDWYSGTWKKPVAAVRIRALDTKGQMQAISLTQRCELQIWNFDWTSRYDFQGTVDFREAMMEEIRTSLAVEEHGTVDSVVALDFIIVADKAVSAKGNEVATLGAEQPVQIWALLQTGSSDELDYYITRVTMVQANFTIDYLKKIKSSQTSVYLHDSPHLVVPKPGHTVYVAFQHSIVLAAPPSNDAMDDPNAQLHDASYIAPDYFEDAIYFRADHNRSGHSDPAVLDICGEDAKSGHSSLLAFVRSVGLARVIAHDPSGDVERSQIPVKDKIEQAVFYGAMQEHRILDFSSHSGDSLTMQNVEAAALAISKEILSSESTFITRSSAQKGPDLENKAEALHALITHVRQNYPLLTPQTLWKLLWDAERVSAAQSLWVATEQHRAMDSERGDFALDQLCEYLHVKNGHNGPADAVAEDRVCATFVYDLARLDQLLVQASCVLEDLAKNTSDAPEDVMRYVHEIDELWATALEAVYSFRAENARLYGIESGFAEDGVLKEVSDYADLPMFWTSRDDILHASHAIPTMSRDLAKLHYETDAVPADLVKLVTKANPRLIRLCCLAYQERIGWLASHDSEKKQRVAQEFREGYDLERYKQFRALASIGASDAGMQLAEKYRDMHTLTELVVGETQYYEEEIRQNPNMAQEERAVCEEMMQAMTERIGRYFEKFGEDWANAFFDEAFSSSRAGHMLVQGQQKWKQPLRNYLRGDPSRAKVCWINDVIAADDYTRSGVILSDLADQRETDLWAKKVELSMSKLSLLAGIEASMVPDGRQDITIQALEQDLRLVKIQEKLYNHVAGQCSNALDRESQLQLAMETLGTNTENLFHLQALLHKLLEKLLGRTVLTVEELIDILTLMDSVIFEGAARPRHNLEGKEFFLALQALDAAALNLEQEQVELLLQIIWKRCYVHDDWNVVITAQKKRGNKDSQAILRDTAAWRTLYSLHDEAYLARPDCHIHVLEPSECFDAACEPAHLAARFTDRDLLKPILDENRKQDNLLQALVVDRELDGWIKRCDDDVKSAIEANAEALAERRMKEREMAKVVGRPVEVPKEKERESGNGVKVNGHVNGTSRGDQHGAAMDGEGDVRMD